MIRLLAGLTGLAAAVVLAACGGDDDAPIVPVQTTTTPVAELDQDEFIDEADSLCAEANVALASITTTGEAGTEAAAIAEQADIYDGLIDDLDALGSPPEDEETLDEFLDALSAVVEALDKQELAAERGEDTGTAATEVDSAEADARAAADDFGLDDCAEEGDGSTTDTGDTGGTDTGAAPAAPTEPAAPAAPAPAPAPAPTPAPAPAPAPAPDDGDTGGTEPGSGGVSP